MSGMTPRGEVLGAVEQSIVLGRVRVRFPDCPLSVTKIRISMKGIKMKRKKDLMTCVTCGRHTPYIIYFDNQRWGWRACFQHFPPAAVKFFREHYQEFAKNYRKGDMRAIVDANLRYS